MQPGRLIFSNKEYFTEYIRVTEKFMGKWYEAVDYYLGCNISQINGSGCKSVLRQCESFFI